MLSALFRLTPPTALLVAEPAHAIAVLGFVGQRGIQIGRDLSLVCMINDPTFAWRHPPLAHFDWDTAPVIRRIVRWAGAVARGRVDKKRMVSPATFIPGGTVMAAPAGRRL